jgi:hypothetical protein
VATTPNRRRRSGPPRSSEKIARPRPETGETGFAQPAQQRQQRNSQPRANALSGNDSRSANWQAQQQRGAQSRQLAARQQQPRQVSGRAERREFDIAKGTDMKSKLLSGMVLFMLSASAMAQQSFSTPDKATDALANAISEQNERAMSNLLGENWRDFLPLKALIRMPSIASCATGKFVITPLSKEIRRILLSETATGSFPSR